jgi:predicted HicB family RNase H-like nuclease
MRPQFQALAQSHEAAARQLDEDLGFNDLGEDTVHTLHQAEVVELKPANAATPRSKPEVRRQQEQIPARLNSVAKISSFRRSALAEGRSAAFTLRLDATRHLQLRLACTLAGRSAQQLVTEALDQMIADLPEVTELTAQAGKRLSNLRKGDPK